MTIKNALIKAKAMLKGHENEAVFILCEYLQKDKAWLFLNEDVEFDFKPYFKLVKRFKIGEAFEYIFKKVDFWGLEFEITKGVLIPRYDSEILLFEILRLCKKHNFDNILEIGFGSGVLSIVLAKELGIKITACDINAKALKLALKNAKLHKVDHLIDFKLCDFREISQNYDFIFSNPPYIKESYPLDLWVEQEPKEALWGGKEGHEILEEIIHFAVKRKAAFLACEFGYDQREILEKILKQCQFKAEFFKDEQGYNRAFVACFNTMDTL
ncbi:peptide chain release factor N(5)-glutamine methyltransferase [Campylobacter sp. VicNov18]|uniref:HemK/PrmC family methyltransferase n=1 Tax=Campylobacter bilis TaxID=2691918 RepID=UPI00130D4E38|nr:HemK/PrmC family methyltransferase [Campylobacter bilis]MPV63502.1 HemK family protein methyltransferase [Campylobacter hepaticus]MBM0637001.1 HemK family protein methyltransferase [Campylobacter bilis]MCC8277713.1 peptide chain release factor N(5)-glutamine methyltransferase [Campylobacter bilis]MCC8299322.1 peptide chain release factor N(5)-glutamine methyltransferase [Campylobacter bilis]MCC8300622.1 peptide chain release factor N(5)-glutamine methyltransferase [Campylobacter bilis]